MRVIKIDVRAQSVYYVEDFATEFTVQEELDLHLGTETPVVGGMVKGHALVVPNLKNTGQWYYAVEGVKGVFCEDGIITGLDENCRYIDAHLNLEDLHVAFMSASGLHIKTNKMSNEKKY